MVSEGATAAAFVVVAALSGIVLQEGVARLGVALPIACVALAVGSWLLFHPLAAVTALIVVLAVLENDGQGFLPQTLLWYRNVAGPVTTTDLLFATAVGAVVLDHARSRRALVDAGALTGPLLLVLGGTIGGAATGYLAGASIEPLLNGVRVLVYLVVLPYLVVDVLGSSRERVRRAVLLVAGVVALKAVVGLAGWAIGQGRYVGDSRLIYYAPTANILVTLVLLVLAASVVQRLRLPTWAYAVGAGALLTLVLSYRRSFWIAFVVGLVLVVVVASGRRGRGVVVLTGAVLVAALWLALNAGGATGQGEGAVVERVRSLNPDRIEATPDDRYRLDEQRNVVEEIRRQPLTGLGLGVPWEARHPLAVEHPGGRDYVHMTVLWYWLKLGPLGLLGYLLLHATAARQGYELWRRSSDPLLQACGIGLGAMVVGLAIAETTGAFTGIEPRATILVAALYGWLVAAHRVEREERDAALVTYALR